MLLRAYLGSGAVLGVAYFLTPDSPLRTGLWVAIALSSAIAIFTGVRRHRPARPLPWILIALGLISYTIGEFFFYYPQLAEGHEAAVPSIADPFYLVLYPCLAGGLIVFVRRQSPGGDRPALLDGMIITVGVALLTWVFLIQPYVNDRSIGFAERATSIAYPLGDVLVLAVFARLGTGRASRGTAFRLLGIGMLALLFADAFYTVESSTGCSWPAACSTPAGCSSTWPSGRPRCIPRWSTWTGRRRPAGTASHAGGSPSCSPSPRCWCP